MKFSLRPEKREMMNLADRQLGPVPVLYDKQHSDVIEYPDDFKEVTSPRSPGHGESDLRRSAHSLKEIAEDYDVHAITPRQMVDLSFDLYSAGFLDHLQYADLAFQAELMPNYDTTIGALTGNKAAPDRPRDFTTIWRDRLRFEKTYCADDPRLLERAESIFKLLLSLRELAKPNWRRPSSRPRRESIPLENFPALSLKGNPEGNRG